MGRYGWVYVWVSVWVYVCVSYREREMYTHTHIFVHECMCVYRERYTQIHRERENLTRNFKRL